MLWICHDTAFWLPWFPMKNQLLTLLSIRCTWWVASFLLLSRFFSLFLSFDSLIIMCLGVHLFMIILLGVHWTSVIYILNLVRFQTLFLQIVLQSFLCLLLLGCALYWSSRWWPTGLSALLIFLFFLFLSVPQIRKILIEVFLSSLILYSTSSNLFRGPSSEFVLREPHT